MKIFEGKSPAERNKIIAAIVLGVMALLALTYTFGGFSGSKKTVTVNISPTPTASASPNGGSTQISRLPTQEEVDFQYSTTPVAYNPGSFYAPDAGRNIFAFYEPPPPTPYSPTPPPTPTPFKEITPTPAPVYPQNIGMISPQSVYSGSKTFLLEVNGEGFTPDTRIIFNGSELPTTYVSPQRLTANVPSNFISGQGTIFIMTRTPDSKLYSNQVSINVQAPPTPQFQYIGAKLAQRENNNTAYFQEQGKDKPFSARLNDVVGGRFRIMSISSVEVVLEDINLEFRHRLPLYRPAPGQVTSTRTETQNNQNNPNYNNPNNPTYPTYPTYNTEIPGIPNNIPRYNPNNTNTSPIQQQQQKQKTDNNDDEDGDN